MRFAAPIAALLLSSQAYAGGIGPLVIGGFHTEPLYFYSKLNADGLEFASPQDYDQYKVNQVIGNVGSGLELVLGDRDDFIQGSFRFYWMMDMPQMSPLDSTDLVDEDALVASWRENSRNVGIGTVGLQWGVVRAANDRFKFGISAHVGTGFMTTDQNEFLLVQAGANIAYKLTNSGNLEFYVDLTYGLRVRKILSHGAYGTAGLRVLFD